MLFGSHLQAVVSNFQVCHPHCVYKLVNVYAVIKHKSLSFFTCYILIIKLRVSAGSGYHQVFSKTNLRLCYIIRAAACR